MRCLRSSSFLCLPSALFSYYAVPQPSPLHMNSWIKRDDRLIFSFSACFSLSFCASFLYDCLVVPQPLSSVGALNMQLNVRPRSLEPARIGLDRVIVFTTETFLSSAALSFGQRNISSSLSRLLCQSLTARKVKCRVTHCSRLGQTSVHQGYYALSNTSKRRFSFNRSFGSALQEGCRNNG